MPQSLQDRTALNLAKLFQTTDHIKWGYTKRTAMGLEVGMKIDLDLIDLPGLFEGIADCNPRHTPVYDVGDGPMMGMGY